MGDLILSKADRLMAEAIETVAALYKDGIIAKPKNYPANYPFLLTFMHTNGEQLDKNLDKLSYIDQTKDLGEIKELAKSMRSQHKE